jgi:hypothetical protein
MLAFLYRKMLMLLFLSSLTIPYVPLFSFKKHDSYFAHYPCLVFLHTALYKLDLLPVLGDIWALELIQIVGSGNI